MSDTVNDLAKRYQENVLDGQRTRRLFPIPEEPQAPGRGMWSVALGVLLTTLRYLAPATLLTLFWGQHSFLCRLIRSIDNAFRATCDDICSGWESVMDLITARIQKVVLLDTGSSAGFPTDRSPGVGFGLARENVPHPLLIYERRVRVVFSSEEQKQEVLRWLSDAGPVRIQRLDTVWRHGWIVCSVLDAALPGTCAGHSPSTLSLKHAQAIAEHYLGVEPVFSRHELEGNDSLSRIQEWKLATYLGRIKQALSQITPPVSKPVSERTSPETTQFTMDYTAKGSGLTAAQVNNKMYFKIYPTSQQSLDPGEITVLIRGPKDTYGMSVLPPLLGKSQMIRQQLIGLDTTPIYTEKVLPITHGATYFRTFGKNDMNKTFHIPKTKYDIEIEAKIHSDYIRIGYTVNLEGRHDISITSRGQHIVGSPFVMKSSSHIVDTLESESSYLEDGEEIDIMDMETDRKVVLRIVDFVTEKMLLRENGSFEKISDDEAEQLLMTTKKPTNGNTDEFRSCSATSIESDIEVETRTKKLRKVARKVIQLNRVCKIFREIATENQLKASQIAELYKTSNKQPDIVNSTINDSKSNSSFLSVSSVDIKSKSVGPTSEKTKMFIEESKSKFAYLIDVPSKEIEDNTTDSSDQHKIYDCQIDQLLRADSSSTSSNPFLNDVYEQELEKGLRTFVKSEFETNRSQSEETATLLPQILVEEDLSATPSPVYCNNPFADPEILTIDRPKTPVLKIIKGEVKDRDDSVYVNLQAELFAEELLLANEFINPLFVHKHQMIDENTPITDFIIGAPVSLPPMVSAEAPEQDMDSIVVTAHPENSTIRVIENYISEEDKSLDSLNPPHCLGSLSFDTVTMTDVLQQENVDTISSTFHSINSSYTDKDDRFNFSNMSNPDSSHTEAVIHERRVKSKKDMWDSAYVSIDESTSTLDSNSPNNTSSTDTSDKFRMSPSDDYFNMGPAEKEIWLTCKALSGNISKTDDCYQSHLDIEPKIITSILEENDRPQSSGLTKETRFDSISESIGNDSVPVTFANLNTNLYLECLSNEPGRSNATNTTENYNIKTEHKPKLDRRGSVDSASGISDVKRRAKQLEGRISEVQANVTESGSVSQTLHQIKNYRRLETKQDSKDSTESRQQCPNIVIEKKHYWDERIREIEAKAKREECKENSRRLSTRNLIQNDSLTKKRAKEVANNFMTPKGKRLVKSKSTFSNKTGVIKEEPLGKHLSQEKLKTDSKIVMKWRKYWDTQLDSEKYTKDITSIKSKSADIKDNLLNHTNIEDLIEENTKSTERENENGSATFPVKEELSEEVFKAFETSPKRFFGTSRKQILNKIDSFLEKPSTADSSSTDASGATPDTGLVCSRISLFHTISKTEEPSWVRRKCQSMQNISMRKFSESSIYSTDDDRDVKTKYTTQTSCLMPQSTSNSNETDTYELPRNDTTSNTHMKTERIPIKEKRARLVQNNYNATKSFEETLFKRHQPKVSSVKGAFTEINNNDTHVVKIQNNFIRKSSVSKSEMDIFTKVTNTSDDDLDVHKSYDELPRPCVKNFISLYESVSSSDEKEQMKRDSRCSKKHGASSSSSGAANKTYSKQHLSKKNSFKPLNSAFQTKNSTRENWKNKSLESVSSSSIEPRSLDSTDQEPSQQPQKETTYVSYSDIELEIVENTNEPEEIQAIANHTTDYKSRFKMAKQYFQSLEELPPVRKLKKPNECEILLMKSSTESLEIERPQKQKRMKKTITKSLSPPLSEISAFQDEGSNKLAKISEKFNVDDLFNDVIEGKISRQGSLRGIPHKKAVLEAFRSIESLVPTKMSSYDIAVSQLNQFAKENNVKTAQTYLNEYPYLPTTEPSKYHSRLDAKAHGLISLKELTNKPRRNSVPDLRLNTKFTVDL